MHSKNIMLPGLIALMFSLSILLSPNGAFARQTSHKTKAKTPNSTSIQLTATKGTRANGNKFLVATGTASYYASAFQGKTTANGETFNMRKFTAAHRSLPFGTIVRVTNLNNGKMVFVTINDRGPYVKNRIIDLSKAAAKQLDLVDRGIARVRIEAYN